MALVHRSLTLWPLVGLACAPFGATAATLTILDGAEAEQSVVQLNSVRFEPATKRLVVTTVAGNIDCGVETTLTAGQMGLVINDSPPRTYALRTALLPAERQPIEYSPTQKDFEVLLPSTVGTACASNNSTDFKLQFDGGALLSISEQVYFDLASKTFDIRINDPVLCYGYAAAGTGLKIALTSPAESAVELLAGFTSVDYRPGAKVLDARSAGAAQCLDFPVTTQAAQNENNPDRVFAASFEANDVEADLSLVAKAVDDSDVISRVAGGDQSFNYVVEIRNNGNGAAAGVRVRELLPNGVAASGSVSWECTRYASATAVSGTDCGSAAGGRLDADAGNVGPGELLVYTLHRQINGGAIGSSYRLGAAAFVNPTPASGARPERNFSDNSDPVTVNLVANQPPVITPPLSGMSVAENDATSARQLALQFSITDPEGDAIIGTPTATVSDTALFPTAPVTPGANPGEWIVTLQPAPFDNGPATVTLTATDGNGPAVSSPAVSVSVTAVNDPPQFTMTPISITVIPGTTAGCAIDATNCSLLLTDFLTDLLPGPTDATDEAGQTVRPVVHPDEFTLAPGACRPATVTDPTAADFFTFGELPQLLRVDPNNKYNLKFRANTAALGSVVCDIVVNDGQVDSAPQTLTIKMSAPAAP